MVQVFFWEAGGLVWDIAPLSRRYPNVNREQVNMPRFTLQTRVVLDEPEKRTVTHKGVGRLSITY